jgi:hypothetical protein
MIMRNILGIVLLLVSIISSAQNASIKPLRVGIDGLTHTHVHWILGRAKDGDIEIVGIAEPNKDLAMQYLKQYNLSADLLFPSLEKIRRWKK